MSGRLEVVVVLALVLADSTTAWISGSSKSAAYWTGGSREALPIVVVNTRHVPKDPEQLEAYNKAHVAASDYMMNNIRGTKAAFQTTDAEDVNVVHDLQWWDSLESFFAHTDQNNEGMMEALNNWIPKYDLSIPFKGHVFGGWTPQVRKTTVEVGGADFTMVPRSTGFIKQTGDGVSGPPVIVYNHRKVLPGKMTELLRAQQAFADDMYKNVPGVVALTAGVDAEDPLLLHDLQVFASFETLLAHQDVTIPRVKKLWDDWINFDKYDKSEPFYGVVWAPRDQVEAIKKFTSETSGAKFDVYPIEDIQGSVNLNNWEN